jgi:mRNA interferase MazF
MSDDELFDVWNTQKKVLQKTEPNLFPAEGEVWMAAVGKNLGFEQDGSGDNFSRPVLVVKKFNNQMFWVAPLSTKQKQFDFYYNCVDPMERKISVILAQLRLISVKRCKRNMYVFPPVDFEEIKKHLRIFLE